MRAELHSGHDGFAELLLLKTMISSSISFHYHVSLDSIIVVTTRDPAGNEATVLICMHMIILLNGCIIREDISRTISSLDAQYTTYTAMLQEFNPSPNDRLY